MINVTVDEYTGCPTAHISNGLELELWTPDQYVDTGDYTLKVWEKNHTQIEWRLERFLSKNDAMRLFKEVAAYLNQYDQLDANYLGNTLKDKYGFYRNQY